MKAALVIIPVYNVESQIVRLLHSLKASSSSYDVLFVNDGSIDKTEAIITAAGFMTLKHKMNKGVSQAILTGLIYARDHRYEKVILMDGDGQHPIEYIPAIINKLDKFDFVTCNRFYIGSNAPTSKWSSNILGAALFNRTFNTNFSDISCGFKGLRLNDDVIEYVNDSYSYQIIYDLLIYAIKKKLCIGQVDIPAIYDYSTFLCTRKSEIMSMINMVRKNTLNLPSDMENLVCNINNNKDFSYHIFNMMFYGFFFEGKDAYIIQCDQITMYDYVRALKEKI